MIVRQPRHKFLQLEIVCSSRKASGALVKEFGGRVEELPRDWSKRFMREQKIRPLRIGKRLVILENRDSQITSTVGKPSFLVIPAGAAFGTGEHPTTAMSLRFLEQITRRLRSGWSLVDLGTGSGILALAAKCFGAKRVVAIDVDPTAISTAKTNAALNNIDDVDFQVGDLRRWKSAGKIDIITANLFSELLIQLLPKLRRSNWLILSGVLRAQEREFLRVLRRKRINVVEVRRRGKWIAVFAKSI